MKNKEIKGSIKTKLLTGVLVIELMITLVFIGILIFSFRQNLRVEAENSVKKTQGVYDIIMKNDTKMLSAALDTFAMNEPIRQIFATHQDRDQLYTAVEETFKSNRERHGITHLYFIDFDGTCFLRVHKKEQFGDIINRQTFVKAKKTDATASGIELGKNVFALRVVSPYFHQGIQIGYLEFGEEIEHFDEIVKKETGVDIAVVVEKKFLKEADYRAGKKGSGKPDDWDDLKDVVIVSSTIADRQLIAAQAVKPEVLAVAGPVFLGTILDEQKTLAQGAFPLKDASGQQVGAVIALHDVTAQTANERKALTTLLLSALLVFSITFLVAMNYLQSQVIAPIVNLSNEAIEISIGNVEKKLESARTDEIGLLIRSFDRMRVSLKKSLSLLSKK